MLSLLCPIFSALTFPSPLLRRFSLPFSYCLFLSHLYLSFTCLPLLVSFQLPPRDPRFDSLCGAFNEDLFKKSYNWLEEKKLGEYRALKRQMEDTKDVEEKSQLQRAYTVLVRYTCASLF